MLQHMLKTIRREYQVAFSKGGQSFLFRIAKWLLFVGVAFALYGTNFFWVWTLGLLSLAICVHFFYRWKTSGWTQAWGGWEELDFDRSSDDF